MKSTNWLKLYDVLSWKAIKLHNKVIKLRQKRDIRKIKPRINAIPYNITYEIIKTISKN